MSIEIRKEITEELIKLHDPATVTKSLIEDLGNGPTTNCGDRSSQYFYLAESGDGAISVALIECKYDELDEKDWYYTIHIVDDINEVDAELHHTDTMSENELVKLLADLQRAAFDSLFVVELMEKCESGNGHYITELARFREFENALLFASEQTIDDLSRSWVEVTRVTKERKAEFNTYSLELLATWTGVYFDHIMSSYPESDVAEAYNTYFASKHDECPICGTPKHDGNRLSGGYILLTTYASLTDEEAKALGDYDETPIAVIAVDEEYLKEYIAEDYDNVDEFLNEYTYDDIMSLESMAGLHHKLAFAYRPDLDEKFDFPATCEGNAMLAFADFIAGKLQENGYSDASKYLDALLDI